MDYLARPLIFGFGVFLLFWVIWDGLADPGQLIGDLNHFFFQILHRTAEYGQARAFLLSVDLAPTAPPVWGL